MNDERELVHSESQKYDFDNKQLKKTSQSAAYC